MGRTFLTYCLPPLLFHLQETQDHAALFASLEYDVQKLQKSISGDSFSLLWCKEALVLLKQMHREFLLLVLHRFNVSMSWNGGVNTRFLDEYMNESLQILEICNLLKSATSEMNRFCIKINIAMESKCFDEFLDEIQTLGRKVGKIQNTIKGRSLRIDTKDSYRNGGAAAAMREAMRIISSILVSVFLYPVPVKPADEKKIYSEIPQMKSFLDSVQVLARCCFNGKNGISGGKSFLGSVEYESVKEAIRDAKKDDAEEEEEEKLERSKVLIKETSAALKIGLEEFESEITKVFEEVLKGRNKLLQQITVRKTY